MLKNVFRMVIFMLGATIAAKLVEMALTSASGRRLARQAGLGDLTTRQGIDVAQRYVRAIVGVVLTTITAIQQYREARREQPAEESWADRVQTYAQVLLAVGSLSKTTSDFLKERVELIETSPAPTQGS